MKIRIAVVKNYGTDDEECSKVFDVSEKEFLRIPFIGETVTDENLNDYRVLNVQHYLNAASQKVHIRVEPIENS